MATRSPLGARPGAPRPALSLEYPKSLGVFEAYADAQRAVDYLSDEGFPVENVLIVGTDLRQVERVLGRMTNGRAAGAGAASGAWFGLLVGLLLGLFVSGANWLGVVITGIVIGAVFGAVSGYLNHLATRGQRDFASISQVVATRYEVLVEHKFRARGQELLAGMPGGSKAVVTE